MSIPRSIQENEINKFVESSSVAGKPSVAVVNPDGSNIGSSSDGAIVDGVSSSVKATVRDYTNSNPIAVNLTDATGDAISTLPVSASSLPLPTGAATSAKQDTGNTSLATLAGAVSGTEVQVDVLTLPNVTVGSALPAGTNAIGKLAANSGVDIGDVDITSIAAGDNNIGNVDVVTLPALAAGTNAVGKLLPPDIDVTTHTNYAKKYYTNAGAVTDGIVWSPAAGKRWHIVSMHINSSAAATVTLEDDKAGGDDPVWKMEMAANSGETINFGEKYPLASGEDAADLLVTTSAGNIYITLTGYEI